jgi:hypothetical protein
MGYYIFVDNSNVWIEGQYASAVFNKQANNMAEAHDNNIKDNNWRIDFGKLLNLITEGNLTDIKKALLVGSTPPSADSLWKCAENKGFEVACKPRNAGNKEKGIDTELVHQIAECLYTKAEDGDIFILVAGDRDFMPSIQGIRKKNITAKLAFWDNVSTELRDEADDFISLTKNIQTISLTI